MRLSLSSGRALRWLALLVVFAALYGLGHAYGLDQYLHGSKLREAVAEAGALGPMLFVSIFVAAVVAQVPGVPFVLLAPALFPWPEAWFLCVIASNVAVAINFALVRRIGGQPLSELERPILRRLFASLDRQPIRSVALLRTLTIMFPPVTSALALTQISARDHALGSALGMLAPITALLFVGTYLMP